MASKDSTGFYVYVHKRATDGRVFYVGKGHAGRAYTLQNRNKHWHSIVNKHGYFVEFVICGMQENLAFELEIELIAFYGLENLCNVLPGGQGSSNVSEKTRALVSSFHKGKVISEETKEKLRKANLGKKQSEETKRKIGEKSTGKKHTAESLLKMSAVQSNRSEETRKKLSISKIGKPRPQSVKDAISKAHSIKVKCNETGAIFPSIAKAIEWLKSIGFDKAQTRAICECAKGVYKTAYKHSWSYQ